ncbi:12127_t:CDS:2 [Acaulospora colombiana]|uniref:12127_t:CDS:1 n=1 Tax=Acaulospora colombiana TaxID=27376 RepID=A0ACA9LW14_9GLOM|nr:12127_t:CDS:2 [Acaulospora colombiana]
MDPSRYNWTLSLPPGRVAGPQLERCFEGLASLFITNDDDAMDVDEGAPDQAPSVSSHKRNTGPSTRAPVIVISSDEEVEEMGDETLKAALELWTSLGLAMDTSIVEEFEEGISILRNALDRHQQHARAAMRESSYIDLDPSDEERDV